MGSGILALPAWLAVILLASWILLCSLASLLEPVHNPKEPPLVTSNLPLIGHVWGLFRHGPKYFQHTSSLTKSPLYTLNVFGSKIYVITSASIINILSKNTASVSFNPFIAEVGIRLTHASKEARAIIERNIDGTEGPDSYVVEIHDHTVAALTPGHMMNGVASTMLNQAWTRFIEPLETDTSPTTVSFYRFVRHVLTISSTTALYGPCNPMLSDPSLEQSFWDYDANLNLLLLDAKPQWTARKAHTARERIGLAFKQYLEADPVGHCSPLIEARYRTARKHGLNMMDAGRLEVGTLIGVLVNTVPTLFYLLCHVYSSDSLLHDIRQEVESCASSTGPESGLTFNMGVLRSQCYLLHSTLQETLRTYSEGATVRLVCEDTTIDNRFLLKKGAILQMPNFVIHRNKAVWKDLKFDAGRFLRDRKAGKDESTSTTAAGSFRPFGGGSTLCPGRHFATTEILGLVALFVWRFDIRPVDPKGWMLPQPRQGSVVENVFPPSHDIDVVIDRRRDVKQKLDRLRQISFS